MAQQSGQEKFQKAFDEYFAKDQQLTYSSADALIEYVRKCAKKGKDYEDNEPVVASEFYFLASLACLFFLRDLQEENETIFKKGKKYIDKACSILNDDEYKLFRSFYQLNELPDDPIRAFEELKQINKLCVSFRLIEHNIIPTETLEYLYDEMFASTLGLTVNKLIELNEQDLTIEACTLLLEFPDELGKLMSFTYLSRIYEKQRKIEESLRCAKQGVDILGSNVEYDYRDFFHQLWAECWTRVAYCNRLKKEYDFAMSLFEKGANLNIVDCVNQLAEMYENGESEDADHDMALQLWQKAKDIEAERIRLENEEKERIRLAEEARLAEERRLAEEARLAEERRLAEEARIEELKRAEKARQEEERNRRIKIICLTVLNVALACMLVWGITLLNTETILDRAVRYQKEGNAVLLLDEDPKNPHLIYMDDEETRYDNMKSVSSLFPVGKKLNTNKIILTLGGDGVKSKLEKDLVNEFQVLSSSDCNITEVVTGKSFLVSKNSNINLNSYSNDAIHDTYLIVKNADDCLIVFIDKGHLVHEDSGYSIDLNRNGDLLSVYGSYFESRYSKSDFRLISMMNYTAFNSIINLDLATGKVRINGDLNFPALRLNFSDVQIGYKSTMNSICNVIDANLLKMMIRNVMGVSYDLPSHISSDGNGTFVIMEDYGEDKRNKYGLFLVNHKTRTRTCIDHGMSIRFRDDYIVVEKYDTFLLFFDSSKNVYYSYSGNKRR